MTSTLSFDFSALKNFSLQTAFFRKTRIYLTKLLNSFCEIYKGTASRIDFLICFYLIICSIIVGKKISFCLKLFAQNFSFHKWNTVRLARFHRLETEVTIVKIEAIFSIVHHATTAMYFQLPRISLRDSILKINN